MAWKMQLAVVHTHVLLCCMPKEEVLNFMEKIYFLFIFSDLGLFQSKRK